jgi:hypothetical protein
MVEIWKDINFIRDGIVYDYTGYYQISNKGRVKSLPRFNSPNMKILKLQQGKRGWVRVSISLNMVKTSFIVSRLVAIHFIPNPDRKPEVNHNDGVKSNNYDWNLEWCYGWENIEHAHTTGLKRKISDKDIEKLVELYSHGVSAKKIAEIIGFSKITILRNLRRMNIPVRTRLEQFMLKYNYDEDKVIRDYQSGLSGKKVGIANNISATVVYRILKKNGVFRRTLSEAQTIRYKEEETI